MSSKLCNLPCRAERKAAFLNDLQQHYNSFNFHPPPFGVKQVNGLNGDSIKYSEASEMSTKVCHGLKQMGAKKGDVLAMFLPNCMEYPVVFGAATNAGKVIFIL